MFILNSRSHKSRRESTKPNTRKLKLSSEDKMQLMDGEPLNDKHLDGSALVLAKQFLDMPSPQMTLRAQRLDKLQPANKNSIFFHNYSGHWALSHPKEGVVYFYNSHQPKILHWTTLQKQVLALYGKRKVKAP